jgi:hypothetical protein
MWYANYINDDFYVLHHDQTEYMVRTPTGTTNIVKLYDAEILEEPIKYSLERFRNAKV